MDAIPTGVYLTAYGGDSMRTPLNHLALHSFYAIALYPKNLSLWLIDQVARAA